MTKCHPWEYVRIHFPHKNMILCNHNFQRLTKQHWLISKTHPLCGEKGLICSFLVTFHIKQDGVRTHHLVQHPHWPKKKTEVLTHNSYIFQRIKILAPLQNVPTRLQTHHCSATSDNSLFSKYVIQFWRLCFLGLFYFSSLLCLGDNLNFKSLAQIFPWSCC
jgi:hypothetical protein